MTVVLEAALCPRAAHCGAPGGPQRARGDTPGWAFVPTATPMARARVVASWEPRSCRYCCALATPVRSAISLHPSRGQAMTTGDQRAGIRPFHVEVPDEPLADLRRRIAATRWPSWELVADRSQGVQ